MLRPRGLTQRYIKILRCLADHPKSGPGIAEELGEKYGTVRAYLYTLKLAGFVRHYMGLKGAWELTDMGRKELALQSTTHA